MQQRIAAIMAGNANPAESPHQAAIAPSEPTAPAAPVVKPPSLMDHVVMMRQEMATLGQQNAAVLQTLEAVAQAVAAMYEMFQPAPQPTYSQQFAQQAPENQEDF